MRVTTTERPGYTLVSPSGVLSRRTVGDLRDGMLKAAAEQPDAVVCDLREVVVDQAALTMLLLVAEQLEQWPVCAFGVVAAEPSLRSALAALGRITAGPRWAPAVADVVAAVGGAAPPVRATLRLRPGRRAPGEARAFLATAAGAWAVEQVDLDDATLVLDELVTNAVLHAGTEIEVMLNVLPGRLRLAVADQARPVPLGPVRQPGRRERPRARARRSAEPAMGRHPAPARRQGRLGGHRLSRRAGRRARPGGGGHQA